MQKTVDNIKKENIIFFMKTIAIVCLISILMVFNILECDNDAPNNDFDITDIMNNIDVLVFQKLTSPTVQKIITEKPIVEKILNDFNNCRKQETSEIPAPGTLFFIKDTSNNFSFSYCNGSISYNGKWYKVKEENFVQNMLNYYDSSKAVEVPFQIGQ
jgi:hypothetical protein